jgi:glutathione S-transferase
MKLYDFQAAPSPRRVRMFLAEKGIKVPTEQVDLRAGAQLTDEFRKLNPWCTVPVLELDDGTTVSEAIAVCTYLEAAFPEPPLMGRTPEEKGSIAMWEHRCEVDGFLAAAEGLRNSTPAMKGRALTGADSYEQIPALAERGRVRLKRFFQVIDARLAESPFVGGPGFSIADITAFITVDFAGWQKVTLGDDQTYARRWYDVVNARPSARA